MRSATVLWALVALAAAGSCAAQLKEKWPPSWYHKHEGPRFEVLKTEKEVEQRRYPASKWVSTDVNDGSWDDAYKTGTKRLDEYWNGGNKPQTKIDKTVPIFTLAYPTGQGQTVQAKWTFEYFLPQAYQEAVPEPTVQDLKVTDVPGYDVWVRVFGGFASEKDILDQAFDFMHELETDKQVKVRKDQFGVAIYDDITTLINRHNEIWVWEEAAPSILERLASKVRHWFSPA